MRRLSIVIVTLIILSLVAAACASTPTPTLPPAPPTTAKPAPATTTTAAPPAATTASPPASPKPSTTASPSPSPKPSASPTAAPSAVAEFFMKNTITLWVNSTAGGTTDVSARLFASYWNEVTGGTMIVKNEPGGTGLMAINNIMNTYKPDGLNLGVGLFGSHVLFPVLFKLPGVQFDPTKLSYIGSFGANYYAFTVGVNSPYNAMSDLKGKSGLVFGADTNASLIPMGAAMVIDWFALTGAKIATGFRGAEMGLAAQRGELTGFAYNSDQMTNYINSGYVKTPLVLLQAQKSDWFPKTPAIAELLTLTDQQKELLKFYSAFSAEKIIYTTPGMPADRLDYLRASMEKLTATAGFVTQAKNYWPVWLPPAKGADVATRVNAAMSSPASNVEWFSTTTNKYIAVK